jgi:hypothetical protein
MLCQKCNRKKCKMPTEFSEFYKCEICNDTCCINCMYLYCSTCNKEFACFWCGTNFIHTNNIPFQEKRKLKCEQCNKEKKN